MKKHRINLIFFSSESWDMEESENNNARARARIGARQKWFFGKNVIFCILVEISSFKQKYARAGAQNQKIWTFSFLWEKN